MQGIDIATLRKKHPVFRYVSYDYHVADGALEISFVFVTEPDITFTPTLTIPLNGNTVPDDIDMLVFNLGMIEAISYWKATCSAQFIIEAGQLSFEQISWWHNLYLHGLGEFLYLNNIDFTGDDFLQITVKSNAPTIPAFTNTQEKSAGNLVLVGGGKDSIVSLHLLEEMGEDNTLMLLNPTVAAMETTVNSYLPFIRLTRNIDPKLLELNSEGYLNGHTPFSAYLAFASTLVAEIYGFENIIVSNEQTAGEENTTFHGMEINHQYSKTLAFETAFRTYAHTSLGAKSSYYSLLRPLAEIQIAALFSTSKKYDAVFNSCNRSHNAYWCGECPKCAFVYLILTPFLDAKRTAKIFGLENWFDKSSIQQHVTDLVGLGNLKPFECVGSVDESRLAIALHYQLGNKSEFIAKTAEKLYPDGVPNFETTFNTIKETWFDSHYLPEKFQTALKNKIKTIGQKGQKVLIAGFGVEGQSLYRFLAKKYPYPDITILESNTEKTKDLDATFVSEITDDGLQTFDVVYRSPGFPLEKIKPAKKITTATNLFFSLLKGKVIGITGTKGKSTTSSLVHHLLKGRFSDVRLVGNIGQPMLDQLERSNEKTIFVVELSSFQLELFDGKPDIAILLPIVPEHLDSHGSFEAYQSAKANITKNQTNGDLLIYYEENDINQKIAELSEAQKMQYPHHNNVLIENDTVKIKTTDGETDLLATKELQLKGTGNFENICAAITAYLQFDSDIDNLREQLTSFQPLNHRLEYVGKDDNGIMYYNDAIATIPEATIHAIQTLGENLQTIIIGGHDRGVTYKKLIEFLAESNIEHIITMPDTGYAIGHALEQQQNSKNIVRVSTLEEAVNIAKNVTKPGNICLLSPAASSYNQFKNFEEKGELFKKLALT